MKVVAIEGSTLSVSQLVELVSEGPVILTRGGEPLVAVRDIAGSDWESTSLAENPRFQAIIEDARRGYRASGGIGLDDLRAELGLDSPESDDESLEGPSGAES